MIKFTAIEYEWINFQFYHRKVYIFIYTFSNSKSRHRALVLKAGIGFFYYTFYIRMVSLKTMSIQLLINYSCNVEYVRSRLNCFNWRNISDWLIYSANFFIFNFFLHSLESVIKNYLMSLVSDILIILFSSFNIFIW